MFDASLEALVLAGEAFGFGLIFQTAVRTGLNYIGWRQGQGFRLEPAFEWYRPFVRVTWNNRWFADLLLMLALVIAAGAVGVAYLLVALPQVTGFSVGILLVLARPGIGNLVLALLDRWGFVQPTAHGADPARQAGSNTRSQTAVRKDVTPQPGDAERGAQLAVDQAAAKDTPDTPPPRPQGWRGSDPPNTA